jgi:hypothetical protein
MTLRIDRSRSPEWELDLGGEWLRGPGGTRLAQVSGTLRGPDLAEPATGTVTCWPLRLPGGIVIGARRIALDILTAQTRLVLDGDPGPPPYLMGLTVAGRLTGPDGDEEVKVWIAPTQLLELWLRLNL